MYAKTMSAHGSHLGWRSWSPVTILKEEKLLNNFPIGPMLKLCPLTVAILDRDQGH